MEYIRIEHTNDFNSRRTVLKTAPNTSPDCLPFLHCSGKGGGRGMEGDGGRRGTEETEGDVAFRFSIVAVREEGEEGKGTGDGGGRRRRKGTLRQRGADGYTGRAIALTSHSPVV